MASRLSVRVARSVSPIILEVPALSSILSLQAKLLSFYDAPIASEIHLRNLESLETEINLATLTQTDPRLCRSLLISFVPINYDFDGFYQNVLGQADVSELSELGAFDAFQQLLMREVDQMNYYTAFVFRHLMLCYAITDIIEGRPIDFCCALPSLLRNLTPPGVFSPEIFSSAFSEIISVHFADQDFWDDNPAPEHALLTLYKSPQNKLSLLAAIVVLLVLKGCPIMPCVRDVLGPFRPSNLTVGFVALCTKCFLESFGFRQGL
jgi:hypothetical protein